MIHNDCFFAENYRVSFYAVASKDSLFIIDMKIGEEKELSSTCSAKRHY